MSDTRSPSELLSGDTCCAVVTCSRQVEPGRSFYCTLHAVRYGRQGESDTWDRDVFDALAEPSVPEAAVVAATDRCLLDGYCLHDRRCVCRSKLRMSAWATLDALLRSGWTLTPPNAQEG